MKAISLRWVLTTIGAAVASLVLATGASAGILDCSGGCSLLFDGALWVTTTEASTGTGVIDSFVRLNDGNGLVEDGHNTSGRPLLNQENSSPSFTRDIQLKNIPLLTIDGAQYYEFLLDINQQKSDSLLALNRVEICTAATGGQTEAGGCPGTMKYSFGAVRERSQLRPAGLQLEQR